MKQGGTYKQEAVIHGWQGAEIEVDGKTLLNFCSNNYLGLAGSRELAEEAKRSLDEHGFGMASVRFIAGTADVHKELESEIAKFFGFDDAILYSSCFDANTGLFETILTAEDAVFSDELNHASIIDGIRLCKAERFIFKHSDMADLEAQLQEAGQRRRKLIVTDGVFSMDGDTAKIATICDLADKYQALVMVDDSHGSGVLGETGRGSIEQEKAMGRVDILTSTFGKALGGAAGGFTAGRAEIVEYLRQRSRPYLFSNTLATVIAHNALYVLRNWDAKFRKRLTALARNTEYFRRVMEKLGFELGGDGSHAITPVMLYDENLAMRMAENLFAKGVYVRGFTYPVVPQGKARIRVQLTAEHTKEQMDQAVAAFAAAGRELGVLKQ